MRGSSRGYLGPGREGRVNHDPMVVADGWDQGCVTLAAADDAVHVLARTGRAQ